MNQRFYEFEDRVLDLNHVISAQIKLNIRSVLEKVPDYQVIVMLSYGHEIILYGGPKEECDKCLDKLKQKLAQRSKK